MTGENYLRFMAELFFSDKKNQEECVETARKISDLGERLQSKIGCKERHVLGKDGG